MTEHWAIIPVKGLTESKSRLSSYLGDNRKLLVDALLQDVLSSIVQSKVYAKVIVISPDESVAFLTRLYGASFLTQMGVGLNRAIEQTNRLAMRDGAQSVTIVLADIPLVLPEDFQEFMSLGGGNPRIVMAPSLKAGTNMMTASPPNLIRPRYGRWSYTKHLREAQALGLRAYSMTNDRVSFDIDTVNDLHELTRRDRDLRTMSGRVMGEIEHLGSPAKVLLRNSRPIIG